MMKFVKYDIKKIEILLMLLFVAFQSRAYDFEKDGIYYNFNGTIPFEVFVTYRDNPFDVGYQPSYSGVVVIPETVEFANKYYRITEIGDFAFRGCSISDIYVCLGRHFTLIRIEYRIKINFSIRLVIIPRSTTKGRATYVFYPDWYIHSH